VHSKNTLKSRKETNDAFIVAIGSGVCCTWCRPLWHSRLPTGRRLSQRELPGSYQWLFIAWLWRFQLSRLGNRIPRILFAVAKLHGPRGFRHSQRSCDERIWHAVRLHASNRK